MLGLGLSLWPNRVPAGTGGTGGTGGYRFWRVLVDNTRVSANIAIPEIRLYAPGTAVSLVTPSTPVIGSSALGGYPPEAVVDGIESGFGWVSATSAILGQWVTLDLGQARQVELVKINPSATESYRPTRVVIQASSSPLTGYVTLAEYNAPVWAPVGVTTPATTFGPLPTQT